MCWNQALRAKVAEERETRAEERHRLEQSAGIDVRERWWSLERDAEIVGNTSNESQTLELVRLALLYDGAQWLLWRVESDLHEYANWCRKRPTLAPLTRARVCIRRARVTAPLIDVQFVFKRLDALRVSKF